MVDSQSHIPQHSEALPAEPARHLRKRFAILGGTIGVFVPFCYGAWLIHSVWSQEVSPGTAKCGMPAVGGFLIIVFGCPVAGLSFAVIGALAGGFFDLIGLPRKLAISIAALTSGAIAVVVAGQIIHESRDAAIRSYVLSVCNSVECFHVENGRYPAAITEIETSRLDNDLGIPLHALGYDIRDAKFVISYSPGRGRCVSYSRPLMKD